MQWLVCLKNEEHYFFLYEEEDHDVLLQTLGKMAADKDSGLTWFDAAVLSHKARLLKEAQQAYQGIE